jgi:spoIIIJ-associated protein
MEWVETTGRTVEEAKDRALDQLGVHEEDAEFEILDEPRPGLFGRMRGEARVRARVRPTRPRPKAERRERRRKPQPQTGPAEIAPAAETTSPDRKGAVAVADDDETQPAPAELAAAREAEWNEGVAFLEGLVGALGEEAEVTIVALGEDEAELQVEGGDLGVLIGPRGQTLIAVQDLTRLAAQRRTVDRHGRLRVDIAGYRERRREALARFTATVAEEVRTSGTSRALEPMSSMDRKVVHDAANELDGVETISEGEEPFRRVVIRPVAQT